MKCYYHPDREGVFKCFKYERHLCSECIRCQNPKAYCKYRDGCAVYLIQEGGTSKSISWGIKINFMCLTLSASKMLALLHYSEVYTMILRVILGLLIGGGGGFLFNIIYRKITAGAGATWAIWCNPYLSVFLGAVIGLLLALGQSR